MSAELIARLEMATEGSRELDADIFIETAGIPEGSRIDRNGGVVGWWPPNSGYQYAREVPHYTTSLDAALTLVPRKVDYELKIIGTPDGETYTVAGIRWWEIARADAPANWQHRDGNKLHPAHALCIAALKTRAA